MALILVLEYVNLVGHRQLGQAGDESSSTGREPQTAQFDHKLYLLNVYCRLLVWFFGAISSELLTDISKVTAGRLRPHFISVCKPLVKGTIELDDYCKTALPYEYITDYTCSGEPKKQRDTRLSFLSGHSSYSAYSATFAVLYIHQALDVRKFGLLKPFIQVMIAAAAFYTGLTRVSDYKHHWQDVLAGLLLGTVVASFMSTHVWPSFYNTYARFLNKNSTNRLSATNEASAAELNRLGY